MCREVVFTGFAGALVAASTATPAAAVRVAAITASRLDTYRLRPDRGDRAAQPVLELDLGLPAEALARLRDVRLANLRIVLRKGLEDDLALRAGHLQDDVRELEQGELLRVAEVDGIVLVAHREQVEAADQVVDEAEAARLRALAEYRQRLAVERLAHERRDRPAVVRPHPRAVRVEDPRDRRIDSLLPVVGHGHRLRIPLRLVVYTSGSDRVHVAPVPLRPGLNLGIPVGLP